MPPLDPNDYPSPFYTWSNTTGSNYGSNAFAEAIRSRQRQAQAEQQRALEQQREREYQQQLELEYRRRQAEQIYGPGPMDPIEWARAEAQMPLPPTVEEIRARAQQYMGPGPETGGFDTFTYRGATVHPAGLGDVVARIRSTGKDLDPIINPLNRQERTPF